MPHDIRTISVHEAGHVVFVSASPFRKKLAYVQITPNDPDEGGRTVLNDHTGKCPEEEKASNRSFVNDSIRAYSEKLRV
jgi:hypothetical protein